MTFSFPNSDAVIGGGLLSILGLAVLGGLVLNLMPCVLPVLSIKLMGVVSKRGKNRREVRLGFLASAAGILFTFLALAGVTIAAKVAGIAIGWGVQFQHPPFLVALALMCVLFAANLWNLYEIQLPADVVSNIAHRNRDAGLVSDFLSGAFATVLATPCSAPFLGTAIGFALAAGPLEILAVFVALGAGLALPYLLIALFPGLIVLLPRPGGWMITLRRILGVALLGTAVWLISVLVAQVGSLAALLVGACLVALLILLWIRQRLEGPKHVGALVSIVSFAMLAFVPPSILRAGVTDDHAANAVSIWQPFDVRQIHQLVKEGRVVFVDVTADWCITCQANKKLVLDRAPVLTRLVQNDTVAMKADWTRPSDQIATYLASFGRYGIPFSVVYGTRAPDGIPLPEILTSDAVIAAFNRAVGDGTDVKQLDIGIVRDSAHVDRAVGDIGIKR